MRTNFTIKQVPETRFGNGILAALPDEIRKIEAQKPLLITDKQMAEQGLTEPVERILATHEIPYRSFIISEKILSFDGVKKAMEEVDPAQFDVIIGYGGWRCTDLAKIMSARSTNPNTLEAIYPGGQMLHKHGTPVISIPTTPPNGAEIDSKVLVRHTQNKTLIPFEHPFIAPRVTLVDPELMVTLPPDLTAATGIDALTHAIEALISMEASPFSEILALQAIALINENLLDSYRNGTNLRARYNVALGSLLAALAINMTGSGAIHALAYPLTAHYGIPHPQATTLISLGVIRYNVPVVPAQFVRVARLLGCQVQGIEAEAIKAVEALEQLYRALEHPLHLSTYNIAGIDLEEFTKLALQYDDLLNRNPRMLEADDILNIYRQIY